MPMGEGLIANHLFAYKYTMEYQTCNLGRHRWQDVKKAQDLAFSSVIMCPSHRDRSWCEMQAELPCWLSYYLQNAIWR